MFQACLTIPKPGYYLLKQAISPENCKFLTEYALFKKQVRPNVKKNIDPLDNVHREYGDPLMELLLEKITPLIEQTLGCAVWPSLSFYYVYHHGNQLQPHFDRSSCQWVASLCIGADPDFQQGNETWPLILRIGDDVAKIALEYGDILLYQGHTTEHWRETFSGQWFVSAIFAFVEQQGPYAFQKYDQRTALGHPHVGMFRWAFGCLKYRLQHTMSRILSSKPKPV